MTNRKHRGRRELPEDVYMAGRECLECGKGIYPGVDGSITLPCTACGDFQPIIMRGKDFWGLLDKRNNPDWYVYYGYGGF